MRIGQIQRQQTAVEGAGAASETRILRLMRKEGEAFL